MPNIRRKFSAENVAENVFVVTLHRSGKWYKRKWYNGIWYNIKFQTIGWLEYCVGVA